MRARCLQHVPFEGPGIFATLLENRGVRLECHLVPEHGLPKDPGDILIVMGGPMSVNDRDAWVKDEWAFIKAALDTGMPVLGVCLGSQFMAKALGATVGPGIEPEIGMTPIRLTEEGKKDAVFATIPEGFDVFQWHGEIFDLPPDAIALAASDLCSTQAFRYRTHAYGLLFHLELERTGIEALCRECPADVAKANLSPPTILARAEPHLPSLHRWADRLIEHLVEAVR